jgi:Family of unknown function (DUF6988)
VIRWRVANLVKRSAGNSDDVPLADFKRVRGLDREWKARTFSRRRSMTSSESYIFLAVFAGLALIALIYLLSPMSLLEDITTRGAEIRTRLRQLLERHQYPGDTKNQVLGAYVDIALEHHKAIWLLSASELNGSAFALKRSMFDAYERALWINKVATAEEIQQAVSDELWFPKMSKMLDDIKRAYFGTIAVKDAEAAKRAELEDSFFESLGATWTTLSSYTHPGGLQIVQRFTGDKVKPKYSEGEIAEALNATTVALLMLVQMFFVSMGYRDEALETRTLFMQYSAEFNERLSKGQ